MGRELNFILKNDDPEIVSPPMRLEINSAEENDVVVPEPPTKIDTYTLDEEKE